MRKSSSSRLKERKVSFERQASSNSHRRVSIDGLASVDAVATEKVDLLVTLKQGMSCKRAINLLNRYAHLFESVTPCADFHKTRRCRLLTFPLDSTQRKQLFLNPSWMRLCNCVIHDASCWINVVIRDFPTQRMYMLGEMMQNLWRENNAVDLVTLRHLPYASDDKFGDLFITLLDRDQIDKLRYTFDYETGSKELDAIYLHGFWYDYEVIPRCKQKSQPARKLNAPQPIKWVSNASRVKSRLRRLYDAVLSKPDSPLPPAQGQQEQTGIRRSSSIRQQTSDLFIKVGKSMSKHRMSTEW